MTFLHLFLIAVVLKLSFAIYDYLKIKKLARYYELWLQDKKENFCTYKSEVVSLFKKAKIKDMLVPVSVHTGYGQIMPIEGSTFDNFPSKKEVLIQNTNRMFADAEGVFRKDIFDAINPLFLD